MTADPKPLTDEELATVREYHLGPRQPGCCNDGVRLSRWDKPCPKCGATNNDTCGGWVAKVGEHVPRLLATIDHYRAERRTPGTVEVCEYEAEHVDHGRCPYQPYEIAINHSLCAREDCPIHRSAT